MKHDSALALEHNGDLYSCDHYVEPEYLVGNINHQTMQELIESDFQLNLVMIKRIHYLSTVWIVKLSLCVMVGVLKTDLSKRRMVKTVSIICVKGIGTF